MAISRTPWAVVTAVLVSALVAGGALLAANRLGDRSAAAPSTSSPPSSEVGPDGCLVRPCTVLASAQVAGTTVELVADRGARSGRLRIGGPTSSDVIEVTITEMGVTLTADSLQCVASALSACVVRGGYDGGTAGQVVAGRSGKWSALAKPFVSDAGYLALTQVTPDPGPEVVAVQHDRDRATQSSCEGLPVFAQVFTMGSAEAGCTQDYGSLESLPGYPKVAFTRDELSACD